MALKMESAKKTSRLLIWSIVVILGTIVLVTIVSGDRLLTHIVRMFSLRSKSVREVE